jgi:hypothetical protein
LPVLLFSLKKHNPYTLGRTTLIFVRKSACKIAAVEEGDRTWPEVAPEVASQKAKKYSSRE